MSARHLHVAFTPLEAGPARGVAVVIDLLRASTSIVAMVERGAASVRLARTLGDARAAGARDPELVLVGEVDALRPEGFHYGNSPVELAAAPLAGRHVVLMTTNGAPAIHAVSDADAVLVGCLWNASAVARAAWEAAGPDGAVAMVCAGRAENPGRFGLDDAYCAGLLVGRLLALGEAVLTDAAEAARLLAVAEPLPLALLERSAAGRNVARVGLAADVRYAAEVDRSQVVPRLGVELFLLDGDRR